MIELVPRKDILGQASNLAQEIAEIQKLMFEDDPELFENENDRIKYLQMFDVKDLSIQNVTKSYKIISFDHFNLKTFASELGKIIPDVLKQIAVERLFLISHLKMNYFGANLKHTYPPIKRAYKKLQTITNGTFYDGGFKIKIEDLPELVEIAFWIERCDASAPEFIFFHDSRDRFCFSLCKYGCIHLTEFSNEQFSSTVLKRTEFTQISGKCQEKFGGSKIEGRITRSR